MGKTKGALERSRRVEGERAYERLEFMLNLMASDSLQVSPQSSTAPEEEGATSRVGFMIIEKTKSKGEREGESMCFPQARQQLRDNDLCFSQNSGISECYI